jgi:hypothetical protein
VPLGYLATTGIQQQEALLKGLLCRIVTAHIAQIDHSIYVMQAGDPSGARSRWIASKGALGEPTPLAHQKQGALMKGCGLTVGSSALIDEIDHSYHILCHGR